MRYLDDGSEEVLLTPRKDVAATYDPSSNTVTSYDYGSFGAEEGAALSSSYDLKDNPHRYAGAYRDPLWGGYYLKARWYDPDLATFLSRDPVAGFHPYSYGDGSPAMNVDPTGTSAQTSGHVAGETNFGGVLFNVFVAPLISIFTKEYWSDVAHNRGQAATFLGLGIAAEVAFFGLDSLAVSAAWRGLRNATRWTALDAVDVGLNVSQAAVSATHGGQFDANQFGQNLEGLPVGMFYARGVAGFGRRTHALRGGDVAWRLHNLNDDTVLVFRSRRGGWSSPALEAMDLGLYHDQLIAVSTKGGARSRVVGGQLEFANGSIRRSPGRVRVDKLGSALNYFDDKNGYLPFKKGGPHEGYDYVGKIKLQDDEVFSSHEMFFSDLEFTNPTMMELVLEGGGVTTTGPVKPHNIVTNNTHTHVTKTIKELRTGSYRMR